MQCSISWSRSLSTPYELRCVSYRWPSGRAVPCHACPGTRRAVVPAGPCHHRASCRGMAQGTARGPSGRPEGTAGHRTKVVPDQYQAYLFFLFKISRLHFLTGQLGWMDEPTDYIFYWTIKHRAVGPCLSRATGHGGGLGTARAR